MVTEAAWALAGLGAAWWGGRAVLHHAIVRALHAPRLAHDLLPQAPLPVGLAMHGWGANASTLWPVVPPLLSAGWAVLLLDARCHGESDADTFASLPRFAEDMVAGLSWLAVLADRVLAFLRRALAGAADVGCSASRSLPP